MRLLVTLLRLHLLCAGALVGCGARSGLDIASTSSVNPAPNTPTQLVLYNGTTGDGDTWIWNGNAWTELNVSGRQPPRFGAAMASVGGTVVLFSGWDGTGAHGDTWEFDGASWTQVVVQGPRARSDTAFATLDDKLVVFGGTPDGGATVLGETWIWDGASWTEASTTGPSARAGPAAATVGGRVVLFGGLDASQTWLDDTWSWDGSNWTQLAVPGPSARDSIKAGSLGERAVLFGGRDPNLMPLGDAWSFDGSNWTQVAATGPSPRWGDAMATLGSSIVLFGGTDDATDFGDTWRTWWGFRPRAMRRPMPWRACRRRCSAPQLGRGFRRICCGSRSGSPGEAASARFAEEVE